MLEPEYRQLGLHSVKAQGTNHTLVIHKLSVYHVEAFYNFLICKGCLLGAINLQVLQQIDFLFIFFYHLLHVFNHQLVLKKSLSLTYTKCFLHV